jgi:hypothetical protein
MMTDFNTIRFSRQRFSLHEGLRNGTKFNWQGEFYTLARNLSTAQSVRHFLLENRTLEGICEANLIASP